MQFQKYSRFFVATIFCITFFLSPLTYYTAFATSTSNESEFWHGFYVEHVTKEISGNGVDIGNAESTDYGLTTGNYIYNKSGVSTQDIIDYVSEQYSNATGYVVESVSDYADKVKNVLNRTIDGTLSAGYKAEKALRTVVDSAGNVYYNVSSSDYWNGIYNKWFNNKGYKDQYTATQGDSYSVNTTQGSYNLTFVGIGGVDYNSGILNGTYNAHLTANASMTGLDGKFIVSVSHNGKTGYVELGNIGHSFRSWTFNSINYSWNDNYVYIQFYYIDSWGDLEHDDGRVNFTDSIISADTSNIPVLQPSQVGFIQYPLGEKTPIYTDPSLNPSDWIINDNGTVTIDGNDYPALIDEKEIDDNGWLDMLNLLDGEDSREMSLKDPWGAPWDTKDDGTELGGFFGNLVKDIQKMFKGIGDKIKEIFQKPIDVLSDLVDKIKTALTEFFTFSPDDLNVDVSFDFDILESIWDAFLEQFWLE